jgi:hypothetical protein
MERAAEYFRRAAQAEKEATFMSQSDHKRQLLDIAQQWRDLARQAEELAKYEAAKKSRDR